MTKSDVTKSVSQINLLAPSGLLGETSPWFPLRLRRKHPFQNAGANKLIWLTLFVILIFTSARGYSQEHKIVFLGDSLTAGLGLPEGSSFPSLIQERLRADGIGWTVVNAGVSGDTTSGALRRIPWILKSRPEIVFLALGANDGLRGTDPSLIKMNLEKIVSKFKEAKVRVVLAGMKMPVNYGPSYSRAFGRVYSDVALKEHLDFYPFLLEGVAMNEKLNLSDGIHPNEEGQKIVAEKVYGFLKPILWPKKY